MWVSMQIHVMLKEVLDINFWWLNKSQGSLHGDPWKVALFKVWFVCWFHISDRFFLLFFFGKMFDSARQHHRNIVNPTNVTRVVVL